MQNWSSFQYQEIDANQLIASLLENLSAATSSPFYVETYYYNRFADNGFHA